jgi:peptide-methionine (S)-S-oxide reductase
MRSVAAVLGLAVGLCGPPTADSAEAGHAVATFAGGRFWSMEAPFDALTGVVATTAGFMGGHVENPTYEAVSAGGTGHFEVVQVVFDPHSVSYSELLDVFWRNIDPLDGAGQFCDRGAQYRSAIFVHDDEQENAARRSKVTLERSGVLQDELVTAILPAGVLYRATEDHQDYYLDHPLRYRFYRATCGRDARLEELWADR